MKEHTTKKCDLGACVFFTVLIEIPCLSIQGNWGHYYCPGVVTQKRSRVTSLSGMERMSEHCFETNFWPVFISVSNLHHATCPSLVEKLCMTLAQSWKVSISLWAIHIGWIRKCFIITVINHKWHTISYQRMAKVKGICTALNVLWRVLNVNRVNFMIAIGCLL